MRKSQQFHQDHIDVEFLEYELELFEQAHVLIFDLRDFPLDLAYQIVKLNNFLFFPFFVFLINAGIIVLRGLDAIDEFIDFNDVEYFACDSSTVISVNVLLFLAVDDQERTEFFI